MQIFFHKNLFTLNWNSVMVVIAVGICDVSFVIFLLILPSAPWSWRSINHLLEHCDNMVCSFFRFAVPILQFLKWGRITSIEKVEEEALKVLASSFYLKVLFLFFFLFSYASSVLCTVVAKHPIALVKEKLCYTLFHS